MILEPISPIVTGPIVSPIVQSFVSEYTISWEAVWLFLKITAVVVGSIIITLLLDRHMQKRCFVTNRTLTLILSSAVSLVLSLRYGLSVYTFQGLFLYFLLLYASLSDLTDRHVADHISISILALSLISVPTVGFTSMLIGGAVTAAVQIGVSMFSDGRYGGADWKISSACAFLLGWTRGIAGLVIGLLIGIVFTLIYNKVKGRDHGEGFALVPFLSIGMMAMFFV